jgi:signal transduction histidine kinase
MASTTAELRRLLHDLREPLGAFSINVALLGKLLLEDKELKVAADRYLQSIRAQLQRARTALDDMDFVLDTGHAPLPQPTAKQPPSMRS